MTVGNGTHNRTNRKAVEIVIDKDENTESKGSEHCACSCLDVLLCPSAESGGTACLVDKGNDNTENNEEDEDTRSAGNGADDKDIHCLGEFEVRAEN